MVGRVDKRVRVLVVAGVRMKETTTLYRLVLLYIYIHIAAHFK